MQGARGEHVISPPPSEKGEGKMNKRVSRYSRIVFVLFVGLTAAWTLYSQSTTSLRGTITDAQGAVIPGAIVTLTDRDKGLSRQIVTDAVGSYAFLQLPPGTYTL